MEIESSNTTDAGSYEITITATLKASDTGFSSDKKATCILYLEIVERRFYYYVHRTHFVLQYRRSFGSVTAEVVKS